MNSNTATAVIDDARPPTAADARRIIFSSSIGNALEWYDFLIYGYFAGTIGKLFFPTQNPQVSLLLSVGSFGVAFLMRPIGAIVLGIYADRQGRKASLSLSILLMVLGTFTITVMPSYDSIGLVAPLLVILARLVQGFAVGGEFGSATAFLTEQDANRRGFFASWQFATQGMAAVTASGIGAVIAASLTQGQIESWGWRLPFILGLVIGPVGYYIRRYLHETEEFVQAQKTPAKSTVSEFSSQWGNLLLSVGIVAQSTVLVYVLQLYIPTYAVKELGLPMAESFGVVAFNGTVQLLFTPLMGALSDRIGRIRIMLTTSILVALSIYPMFSWLQTHPTIGWLLAMQGVSGLFKAGYSGPMAALLSELFPTKTRSTGLSVGYSLGVTVFGGFAPFIVTWLIVATGDKLAPAYYVLTAAVLSSFSLLVVILMRRRARQN